VPSSQKSSFPPDRSPDNSDSEPATQQLKVRKMAGKNMELSSLMKIRDAISIFKSQVRQLDTTIARFFGLAGEVIRILEQRSKTRREITAQVPAMAKCVPMKLK
jgi:hypothetical protein